MTSSRSRSWACPSPRRGRRLSPDACWQGHVSGSGRDRSTLHQQRPAPCAHRPATCHHAGHQGDHGGGRGTHHGRDPRHGRRCHVSPGVRSPQGVISGVDRTGRCTTRSVLRVLAMRRTLFLVPVDEVATLHAAASLAVGRRERERTLAMFAAGGVGPDTAALFDRWSGSASPRCGNGVRQRPRGLAALDPRLGQRIALAAGKSYAGSISVSRRLLPPRARWAHRPGSPAWLVDRVAGALESHRAVAAGWHPRDAHGRGPGAPHRPVAAGLRARHARGPPLVDRLDGGCGACGAGRQRCDRGGS